MYACKLFTLYRISGVWIKIIHYYLRFATNGFILMQKFVYYQMQKQPNKKLKLKKFNKASILVL